MAIVLLERGSQVLAVTRPEPPLRLSLPGGGVEWHETYVEGAARELTEETGLTAERLRLVHEGWSGDAYVKVFEAEGATGTLRPSEEGYPVWVPLRALAEPPFAAFPKFTRRMMIALAAGRPTLRAVRSEAG